MWFAVAVTDHDTISVDVDVDVVLHNCSVLYTRLCGSTCYRLPVTVSFFLCFGYFDYRKCYY